jgi:transposase
LSRWLQAWPIDLVEGCFLARQALRWPSTCPAIICDKGYASKANREAARARGIAPVIPHKANERDTPAFFASTLDKARSRIEQGFGRLKRFKRVALRCEKTARNFRSIIAFAAGLCLIKFVHTA